MAKVNPFTKYLSVEDIEHIKVVNFIKENYPDVICFHTPNEGKKSMFERYKYSLMGNLKGILDFTFLYPKYKTKEKDGVSYLVLVYHGLLIELKAPEHNHVILKGANAGKIVKAIGKLSPEQKAIIEKLNKVKYKAVACWGAEETIEVIKDYFKKD